MEDTENCVCDKDCIMARFTLKKYTWIYWFRDVAIRWELTDPKFRLKQEVLFSEIDLFGKYYI